VPAARWEQADAAQLGYPEGHFDLVVCQFGVMFFPDKPAAFAEAARVLARGGRLLFNTWDAVDTHGFAAAVMAGVERAFPEDPPSFVAAIPHGYSSRELVRADLTAGGLECLSAETVTMQGHASSATDVAVGFCTGTPLRAAIEVRGDLVASTSIVSDEMTRRLGSGPITAQMIAHVFEARVRTVA
jgi:SAM-dependent methyltransferase